MKYKTVSDLDFNTYLTANGVSKSSLDLIHRSPAIYDYAQYNKREPTASMEKGSLVHTLVLQPNYFKDTYTILPADIKQKRGAKYEEFIADNKDKIIITNSMFTNALKIAEAVSSNPMATCILDSSTAIEESVFCEDFAGVMRKCRPDIVSNGVIYDLKTTKDSSEEAFAATARKYRYHVQAAYYMDVCRDAGVDVIDFGFIVVSTEEPHQCTVFHKLNDEAIEEGRAEYKADFALLQECLANNSWPGNPEEINVLTI